MPTTHALGALKSDAAGIVSTIVSTISGGLASCRLRTASYGSFAIASRPPYSNPPASHNIPESQRNQLPVAGFYPGDKMVALERDKAEFCYQVIRGFVRCNLFAGRASPRTRCGSLLPLGSFARTCAIRKRVRFPVIRPMPVKSGGLLESIRIPRRGRTHALMFRKTRPAHLRAIRYVRQQTDSTRSPT